MRILFHKNAKYFLETITEKQKENLRTKINVLVTKIEQLRIIPFTELDIKKLHGKWNGFFRMKIGKFRIIFSINLDDDIIYIYGIDYRGNIYKNK